MSSQVVVHKGRREALTVWLGMDVSGDTFTSQIRSQPESDAELIAEWTVAFATDGTDGILTLVLDDSVTETIVANSGYMDIKRVSGGQPLPVFDQALEVVFRGSVTV